MTAISSVEYLDLWSKVIAQPSITLSSNLVFLFVRFQTFSFHFQVQLSDSTPFLSTSTFPLTLYLISDLFLVAAASFWQVHRFCLCSPVLSGPVQS